MARILLVLLAVFVVPSIVTANLDTDPFVLGGSVYCDTCRCGYQTSASKPLAGKTSLSYFLGLFVYA